MKFSFGDISSLLFEPSTTEAEQPAQPATPAATSAPGTTTSLSAMMAAPTPAVVTTTNSLPTSGANPTDTQAFVDRLRNALAASPSSDPIQHFMAIADSLSDALPEEGARFRAALKTISKTEQVSQPQLVAAFEAMLGILNGETSKFSKDAEVRVQQKVTTKEQELAGINQQIEQLSQRRDQVATELATNRQNIASTQASFSMAVSILTAEVNDSLNKLKIYAPTQTATVAK